MKYTLTDNTLTITDAPRIPGINTSVGLATSGERNTPKLTTRRGRLELCVGPVGGSPEIIVPDGVADVERMMDELLLWNGDITQAAFEEKYPEPAE